MMLWTLGGAILGFCGGALVSYFLQGARELSRALDNTIPMESERRQMLIREEREQGYTR